MPTLQLVATAVPLLRGSPIRWRTSSAWRLPTHPLVPRTCVDIIQLRDKSLDAAEELAASLMVIGDYEEAAATLEALLAISKTARPQQARRSIIEAGGAQICDQDGAVGYAEVTAAILFHPTYRARTVNNTRTRGGAA